LTDKRLEKGMIAEKEVETDTSMAADRFHEKSPRVVSTPSLVGIIQAACAEVMAPFLVGNEMVVSVKIEMSHFGAVQTGTRIKLKIRTLEVRDRLVVFGIEASDGAQTVASGKNEMFVIDRERFEKGVKRHKAELEKLQ